MDPQQRILLMQAWRLFEDAGLAPMDLPTHKIGVFIGMMNHDYNNLLVDSYAINEYTGSGSAFSIASGRLAYTFNLNGPNMTIDTACSSSLVAVYEACQSLKEQECELAIAGGVNLLITPDAFIGSCDAGMLSQSGQCRPFDKNADGYVRAEGCGLVLLKPLSKAIVDQDHVYAVIEGGAINQDGYGQSITVPNVNAQKSLLKNALRNSNIKSSDVCFVEAHGTGTKLGDPIESQSIQEVFGNAREGLLRVGSVKANIGHSESAAGIASLIKTILSIYHHQHPPQAGYDLMNPLCEFNPSMINVANGIHSWPRNQKIVGGVSAFSFSGTNVHLLLRDHENKHNIESRPRNPDYVFNLKRYWPDTLRCKNYQSFLPLHKLDLPDKVIFYESILAVNKYPQLKGHQVFGRNGNSCSLLCLGLFKYNS